MIISIDNKTPIRKIQTDFAALFPFLKLEFFRPVPKPGTAVLRPLPAEAGLLSDKELAGARVDITGAMKVADLEAVFMKEAGLRVQVFRRSGSVWIETSLTADWTLEQQNREGEMLSVPMETPVFNPINKGR